MGGTPTTHKVCCSLVREEDRDGKTEVSILPCPVLDDEWDRML